MLKRMGTMVAAVLDEMRTAMLHHVYRCVEHTAKDPSHEFAWAMPVFGIDDPFVRLGRGRAGLLPRRQLWRPSTKKRLIWRPRGGPSRWVSRRLEAAARAAVCASLCFVFLSFSGAMSPCLCVSVSGFCIVVTLRVHVSVSLCRLCFCVPVTFGVSLCLCVSEYLHVFVFGSVSICLCHFVVFGSVSPCFRLSVWILCFNVL